MNGRRTYEQLDDFVAYTEQEEWTGYIRETVVPLWESAWRLQEFHNRLQNAFDGRRLETLSDDEQQLFLGGVDPQQDAAYRRDSIAKFYKTLFGAQVTDLQSWLLSEGGEVQTEVTVTVAETPFVEFATAIYDRLTQALSSQSLFREWHEPDVDAEALRMDPAALRALVAEFYQQVLDFVVNHSYHTFFLWSLNQVPRRFLEEAYPALDDELPLPRDQFGLTNLDWANPIKPDADIYQEYQILCFPEYNPDNEGQSFGGAICKANEMIWSYFHDYQTEEFREALNLYFTQVPDLQQQYVERVEHRMSNVPEDWIGREFSIYYSGLSASTDDRSSVENSQQSIMDVLDQAAPLLFVGLNKITGVYDNRLRIQPIGA